MNSLKPYFIRENIIKSVREYFYKLNFHEVIIPILNKAIPNEPNIYPFKTTWITNFGKTDFFLPTSPEKNLKKMLSLGIGNCFAISASFRNLENSGSQHSPEFLMLEWYRVDSNFNDIIDDLKNLIPYIGANLNINHKYFWKKLSLIEAFNNYAGIDYLDALKTKSFYSEFDQLFVNKIEPNIGNNPTFIVDYPSKLSPLCLPNKKNPLLADRFELYINGMEIANGNTENTDINSIKKLFIKEQKHRKDKNNYYSPVDIEFLNSLKVMSKNKYAGVGLGIDRLSMLFSNIENVNELY